MKIICYTITEQVHLVEMPPEEFVEPWRQGQGIYFVDIQQCQPEELELWLRNLDISEMAIHCCINRRKSSVVFPFDTEVYFEFPVNLPQSGTEPVEDFISFLCMENLVISMYTETATHTDRLIEVLKSQWKLAKASTSSLLSVVLAAESLRVAHMVDKLRESVFELDERMDRDPDSIEAEDIRKHKRYLRTYDTLANGQAACLDQLRVLETSFFNFSELSTYFQLASANASTASQAVSRLDKTVSDLSQRFDSNQQEKTNHRLAVLTILSAIFMPLTLIAGIYGMNFDNMPELHFSWSYPIVMITMLIIAGGMYHYFKSGGWLD